METGLDSGRSECSHFSVRHHAHQLWLRPGTSLGLESSNMAPSTPVVHLLLTCVPKASWAVASARVGLRGHESQTTSLGLTYYFSSPSPPSGVGSDQENHIQLVKVGLCAFHFGLCTCSSLILGCSQPSSLEPPAILYLIQELAPPWKLSFFLNSVDNVLLCASNIAWTVGNIFVKISFSQSAGFLQTG